MFWLRVICNSTEIYTYQRKVTRKNYWQNLVKAKRNQPLLCLWGTQNFLLGYRSILLLERYNISIVSRFKLTLELNLNSRDPDYFLGKEKSPAYQVRDSKHDPQI